MVQLSGAGQFGPLLADGKHDAAYKISCMLELWTKWYEIKNKNCEAWFCISRRGLGTTPPREGLLVTVATNNEKR